MSVVSTSDISTGIHFSRVGASGAKPASSRRDEEVTVTQEILCPSHADFDNDDDDNKLMAEL